VWQIACGEPGRYYDDLFLDHDVMFLGPGRPGEYDHAEYGKWVEAGRITSASARRVRRFQQAVQPGDVVLLRKGYRVIAVGLAAGHTYHWNETLDDVYGWDLQHCRSVSWQRDLDGELSAIQAETDLFALRKQIPTFTRVEDSAVLDPIKHLFQRCERRPPKAPPEASSLLSLAQLGQRLFAKGLPNSAVDQVLRALERQRRLVTWYDAEKRDSGRPTEHEVVAHMVLPLLLALGWSEQLLAVEWRHIDLAAFQSTPTTVESCVLVCEVKKRGSGMQEVWRQAHGYVDELRLASCRSILVTEGARFYIYSKSDGVWSETPTGYFNVEKLREKYLAPKGTSAVDTIVGLTPMNQTGS
jgi:hypothetical protein